MKRTKDVGSPRPRVTGGCEQSNVGVGTQSNWGPLEDQVFLTVDTFPAPKFLMITFIHFMTALAIVHVKIIEQVIISSSFFQP